MALAVLAEKAKCEERVELQVRESEIEICYFLQRAALEAPAATVEAACLRP